MPGPKRDIAKDKKIQHLRSKGLSFREIAKILDISSTVVYYRYKRSVSKLST